MPIYPNQLRPTSVEDAAVRRGSELPIDWQMRAANRRFKPSFGGTEASDNLPQWRPPGDFPAGGPARHLDPLLPAQYIDTIADYRNANRNRFARSSGAPFS
jgi:hypothetical protein